MQEAIVHPDGIVTTNDAPIPTPDPHEILVKVVIAGTNPKDWMFPRVLGMAHNSGDDLAGMVEAVGSDVRGFRKGDRVAGMHKFPLPHGAFAEYAILPDYMTFPLPDKVSFEQAATIPLAVLTAAFALFHTLGLPSPWQRAPSGQVPLVVYGASSAVGAFAIKLAKAADIHPIVAIGSSNSAFVKEFIDDSQGDALIDYKAYDSPVAVREAIQRALEDAGVPEGRPFHALDTVSSTETYNTVLAGLMAGTPEGDRTPKIATVLPGLDYSIVDSTIEIEQAYCGLGHEGDAHDVRFAAALFSMLSWGLEHGWLKGHPYEVRSGGLNGLESALLESKEGKVRAKKLLLRIAETPGL